MRPYEGEDSLGVVLTVYEHLSFVPPVTATSELSTSCLSTLLNEKRCK